MQNVLTLVESSADLMSSSKVGSFACAQMGQPTRAAAAALKFVLATASHAGASKSLESIAAATVFVWHFTIAFAYFARFSAVRFSQANVGLSGGMKPTSRTATANGEKPSTVAQTLLFAVSSVVPGSSHCPVLEL